MYFVAMMPASQRAGAPGLCSISFAHIPFRRHSLSAKINKKLCRYERSLEDLQHVASAPKGFSETGGNQSLTGTWKKNKDLSDSMDRAFAAVNLPWIYRKAVGFLNYLRIENGETYFKTTLQAGGIMDVVEEYPWSGEIVQHKRRDKRAGNHTGRVAQTDEGPQLQLEWGEPYGGKGTDTFVLSNQGQRLTQVSQMIYLDDESKNFSYRTVYNRWQEDR